MLNMRELICGNPSALRDVLRYNNTFLHHRESVAEHMFYTAFYTMMIGKYLIGHGHAVDLGLALQRAIVHDVDETFSGDIIRTFKHSSLELLGEIQKANVNLVSRFFTPLFPNQGVLEDLDNHWKFAKDHRRLEGKLVAFADHLSVVSFLYSEIVLLGNRLLSRNVEKLGEGSSGFLEEEYSEFGILRLQAHDIVEEILKKVNL